MDTGSYGGECLLNELLQIIMISFQGIFLSFASRYSFLFYQEMCYSVLYYLQLVMSYTLVQM